MESAGRAIDKDSLSVLVLDRLPAIVEGTKRMLEQAEAGRFLVCGATDLNQALKEMQQRFFDCVLVDLFYPNVLKAVSKINSRSPRSRILMFTNEDPAPYFNQVIKAGAVGFISKTCSSEQMAGSIIAAVEGCSSIPIRLLRELRRTVTYIEHHDGVKCEEISEREEEAIKYLALGYTYKEMAAKMYLSQRSVELLVSNLYRKFNVSTRKDMISRARELKLLPGHLVV